MKRQLIYSIVMVATAVHCMGQNRDPLKAEIITSDLDNFWVALDKAGPDYKPEAFQEWYIRKGSKGVKGFMKGRIRDAEYLASVVSTHPHHYHNIRPSLDSIAGMKEEIRNSFVKLHDLYPQAIFPPVYFVIGGLSSGGTQSDDGLIIGSEMYGRTPQTDLSEMNAWLKTVVQPVNQVPHIVAHELIHFQQKYDGGPLLNACIKEGGADFMAELISGRHINAHVHTYANPREAELWAEFQTRMNGKDYNGWLYSATGDRPNDLGYWMGYKIVKAYYDKATDKQKAVNEIMHIKDFRKFLEDSGYRGKS